MLPGPGEIFDAAGDDGQLGLSSDKNLCQEKYILDIIIVVTGVLDDRYCCEDVSQSAAADAAAPLFY